MSPFHIHCQLILAIIWFPVLLYSFHNYPSRIQRQRISKDVSSATDTEVEVQQFLGGVDLGTILENSDKYKESSRVYRRPVFKESDWAEFRASDRLFKNLKTMFISGTVRGLLAEVGSVLVVSTIVWITNFIILSGLLEEFGISRQVTSLVSLPVLPFQLSSPALGLLLVFRTNTGTLPFPLSLSLPLTLFHPHYLPNSSSFSHPLLYLSPVLSTPSPMILTKHIPCRTFLLLFFFFHRHSMSLHSYLQSLVYSRWNLARLSVEQISCATNNLSRQGLSYLENNAEKEELVRRTIALLFAIKKVFRFESFETLALRSKLTRLLGTNEATRIMESQKPYVALLADITRIVRRSKSIDGSTKARFDLHLDDIMRQMTLCEVKRFSTLVAICCILLICSLFYVPFLPSLFLSPPLPSHGCYPFYEY